MYWQFLTFSPFYSRYSSFPFFLLTFLCSPFYPFLLLSSFICFPHFLYFFSCFTSFLSSLTRKHKMTITWRWEVFKKLYNYSKYSAQTKIILCLKQFAESLRSFCFQLYSSMTNVWIVFLERSISPRCMSCKKELIIKKSMDLVV